jgi:hypothetical protein
VSPEVYVKGERSNFSVAVHPTKRWLAWGSSNYASANDESNIADHPVFAGFPYFHGDNAPICGHGKSAEKPVNASPLNDGAKELPPAAAGTLNNLVNVAIGGPIYAFDPSLDYAGKFPPQFDNTWLMAGFQGGLWGVKVESQETGSLGTTLPVRLDGSGIFKNLPIRNFIQGMYGKDGALYVLNYDGPAYGAPFNPGVFRVTYKGDCRVSVAARPLAAPFRRIWIDPQGIAVREDGPHAVSLYDMQGHRVWQDRGTGPRTYRLPAIRARIGLRAGVYLARVDAPDGGFSRRVSLF